MKRICVYCGSSPGRRSAYIEIARALAEELVSRNIGLVYGGANIGIMGELANTVIDFGGEVIGIIPHALVDKEVTHDGITKEVSHNGLSNLKIVSSMHERKAVMADMADGFIALPGGLGTIEELFEILTWAQLGFHQKPCGLLNALGYYDSLSVFLDNAVTEQFVKSAHRNMLLVDESPDNLLDKMTIYKPPLFDKWLSQRETL